MTDTDSPLSQHLPMSDSEQQRIIIVDRLNNGLVLKFADGKCVFFSNAFLYSKQAEGEPLNECNQQL